MVPVYRHTGTSGIIQEVFSMKCKGIVALSKGEVRMMDVDITDPKSDEVQVRMAATMISPGTERAHILALPNSNQEFPYVPGYCCAGIIEKTGSNVTGFSVGDRVACFAVDVGHREIGNVTASRVARIPDGVPFEYAAFSGLGQTSMQGVRKARIELGESVLVIGLGIVGQLALQFAKASGALPAIGVDRIEKRLDIAKACGADYAFNNSGTSLNGLLAPVLGSKGPDVVLESTGFPEVMSEACASAADYARVSIIGCPRGITDFNFYTHIQKKSITLIGAHAVFSVPEKQSYPHFWTYEDDTTCFLNLIKRGTVTVEPLITDMVPWTDAEKMYERLLSWDKDSLGIILRWPAYL